MEELSISEVKHVNVARVLLSPSQRIKVCRVFNSANFPVYVRKHKAIASVSVLDKVLCSIFDGKNNKGCENRSYTEEKLDPIFTQI